MSVDGARLQHARLGRHAAVGEWRGFERDQAANRRACRTGAQLIAGNFSETVTTSLIGERPLKARARQVEGGYRVTGRKMFASMLEAADFVLVMAYPDGATNPSAGSS
jgi:alkylation response protein AidB-like acyl-CoA dehydrogenase